MRELDKLILHAHVTDPDTIAGYLIGVKGQYNPTKIPEWMNEYRTPSWDRMYDFMAPWGTEETQPILERIRDEVDDDVIRAHAEWGLRAWSQYQEEKSHA